MLSKLNCCDLYVEKWKWQNMQHYNIIRNLQIYQAWVIMHNPWSLLDAFLYVFFSITLLEAANLRRHLQWV